MSDKIKPALSAAEWIQYGDDVGVMAEWAADRRPFGPDRRFTMEEKRHAVAAIALHNQRFGFTHQDEALLNEQAEFYEHRQFPGDSEIARKIRLLLGRISALLPPREAEKVLEKLME